MPPDYETNAAYHADDTHVGASMLSVFRENPLLYQWYFVTGQRPKPPPTKPMRMGSALHTLVLVPRKETIPEVAPILISRAAGISLFEIPIVDNQDVFIESGFDNIEVEPSPRSYIGIVDGLDIERVSTKGRSD